MGSCHLLRLQLITRKGTGPSPEPSSQFMPGAWITPQHRHRNPTQEDVTSKVQTHNLYIVLGHSSSQSPILVCAEQEISKKKGDTLIVAQTVDKGVP